MKKWICPTVTARTGTEFEWQMSRIMPFAERIHIDIADGTMTENSLVHIDDMQFPSEKIIDVHLMVQEPARYTEVLLRMKPHMVIVHAESTGDVPGLLIALHNAGIKTGLALLPQTEVSAVDHVLFYFDAVLIFGGHFGYQGGEADMTMLRKVQDMRSFEKSHPQLHFELMWDGGVNEENTQAIIDAGIDVLNVGGFIQAAENPAERYYKLESLLP